MSFNLLPIDVLVNIFHQLPLKDRVSLNGVNQSFRYASMESIRKMKSLVVSSDLITYSVTIQTFPSLLESCSSTLESIEARTINKCLLSVMSDFVYPNLKHLDIALISDSNIKKLIGQCRNVRSVVLRVEAATGCNCGRRSFGEFDLPEDIIFENLEELEIDSYGSSVNLRPLIGNIPNLKRLTIKGFYLTRKFQEFRQLLASIPRLEVLNLPDLNLKIHSHIRTNFTASWRLPNLITLVIVNQQTGCLPPLILHGISTSFPRLESFTSSSITEIDDQSIMALAQLKQLQELRLPNLDLTKEKFIHMMTTLPSIAVLQINSLRLAEGIDGTGEMDEKESMVKFIGFLKSTNAIFFHRNLVIQFFHYCYPLGNYNVFDYSKVAEMEKLKHKLKAVLMEMRNNGGPIVETERGGSIIHSIRYRSCDWDGDYLDCFAFLWRML